MKTITAAEFLKLQPKFKGKAYIETHLGKDEIKYLSNNQNELWAVCKYGPNGIYQRSWCIHYDTKLLIEEE